VAVQITEVQVWATRYDSFATEPGTRTARNFADSLADAGEVVAALPFGGELAEEVLHGFVLGGIGAEGESFAAGEFEEFFIAQRVGDVEAQIAGLAGAEKFAGAAEEEIGFGDFETVGGAHHGFEAGTGFVGHAERGDEDAMGFLRAAADAPAKLVELGEAEALGVLDDHDGGVWDIDADFDDGSGNEDLCFVFAEALHDFFFFVAGEAAVQEAELELGKNFAREAFVFFHGGFQLELRFLDDGIDDVGLVAGGDFAAKRLPNAGEMLLGGHARDDRSAAGREFVEDGNVEVTVESE
jgi:hypothetical protein